MLDAVPHRLVAELVQQLLKRRIKGYTESRKKELAAKFVDPANAKAVAAAKKGAALTAAERQLLDAAIDAVLDKHPKDLTKDEKTRLVDAAAGVDFPDLVALAGYLGGTVAEKPPGPEGKWRILYLDSQLQNWRLVPDDDILVFSRMYAEDAAFNRRDVIWVDRNAVTATGGAPPRPDAQAKYLRGDFTRAGDLMAPAAGRGPSPDPQTGIFCPITPRCCTRPVHP
jgi:hypothetical protein